MNIIIIVIILIIIGILIYYILIRYNRKKDLKIEIKCSKPKVLLRQKKKIILNPVDMEYYNKLKGMREYLREKKIKNYNMNKETINNEVAEINEDELNFVERNELRIPEEINLNNFDNDAQNVHDSTVQDTMRVKFSKLKGGEDLLSGDLLDINDIIKYGQDKKLINSKFREDRLLYILTEIKNRNSTISNLGDATEMDVLKLVWANDKLREQIINELFDSFNSEYNYIVCPTGVVTRLLNADVVLDPKSTPRTMEVLRVEMLGIASQIRNECENEQEYLKMNEDEQDVYLKKKIRDKINDTYKEILSSDIVQRELDSWLENI